MTWDEFISRVTYLLNFEQPPDIMVLHCGGNSIGTIKLHEFRSKIRETLHKLMEMLPTTKLVWSQILPRFKWRFSQNTKAQNIAAERLNNFAAWICIQSGGGYLKYPEIGWNEPDLFCEDGVHLSVMGNELFLYRLQSYLSALV